MTKKAENIIVGISIGDLNGIGAEVVLKTFDDSRILELCTPVIFANVKILSFLKKNAEVTTNLQGIDHLNQIVVGKVNVLNLWKEGVNLEFGKNDDNVGKYLPIFPKWMKGYITIRHCLSHTTGIEAEKQGAGKLFQKKSFATLEEEVNYYAEKRAIANNPGVWFQYDQIGPSIAGRVLEVITKKKFDRLAQEKLFRPLNMRVTSFSNYTSAISPFDGAKSSALEYTNFLSMLLNKGMFAGKQILTEASVAELMKIQTGEALIKSTPAFMNGFSYGLGTWLEAKDGTVVNCVSQNSPFVWIDYCRGYACILLTKKERSLLKRELYDQLKTAVDAQLKSSCK